MIPTPADEALAREIYNLYPEYCSFWPKDFEAKAAQLIAAHHDAQAPSGLVEAAETASVSLHEMIFSAAGVTNLDRTGMSKQGKEYVQILAECKERAELFKSKLDEQLAAHKAPASVITATAIQKLYGPHVGHPTGAQAELLDEFIGMKDFDLTKALEWADKVIASPGRHKRSWDWNTDVTLILANAVKALMVKQGVATLAPDERERVLGILMRIGTEVRRQGSPNSHPQAAHENAVDLVVRQTIDKARAKPDV